jgi:transaldolase
LLAQLQASTEPLPRVLDPDAAKTATVSAASLNETGFRWALNDDPMATDKLAEGIRAFAADAVKLDKMIQDVQ